MILRLNGMEIIDLADLVRAKARRVTNDSGYWLRLEQDLREQYATQTIQQEKKAT